jgi:dephospho-CoA kinase
MIRLGLTGSIGTGKSTTAAMFRARGLPVHDADATVHALYEGPAVAPVEAAFPGATRDGRVDRKALGALLAGDRNRFATLERIVHPLVRAAEDAAITRARAAGHRVILLDIPLLFESSAADRCDVILVTRVDPAEQRRRVLARPGADEALFHAILARQMPMDEKCRRAHAILDTGFGFDAARREVDDLMRALSMMNR